MNILEQIAACDGDISNITRRSPELSTRGKSSSRRKKHKRTSPKKGVEKEYGKPMKKARVEDDVELIIVDHESQSEDKSLKQKRVPFSLSEFARLVVLIRKDPETRQAFIRSSQTILKRTLLDIKAKPVDNWTNVIEVRFNDASLAPWFSFDHVLDEIVSPELPPRCSELECICGRSGTVLGLCRRCRLRTLRRVGKTTQTSRSL
eukprot:gb/GEZJ01003191.1/.p1 GENE.gb/GEZJ01003191.1/~~gb/GEZJ01003191.1/.p1  ORF type:complete len:205 (+),score=24.09 gb/GEZJ01003191.1/:578-1192(+)